MLSASCLVYAIIACCLAAAYLFSLFGGAAAEQRRKHFGGCAPKPRCREKYFGGCAPKSLCREKHFGGCAPKPPCREKHFGGCAPNPPCREKHFGICAPNPLCREKHFGGCAPNPPQNRGLESLALQELFSFRRRSRRTNALYCDTSGSYQPRAAVIQGEHGTMPAQHCDLLCALWRRRTAEPSGSPVLL